MTSLQLDRPRARHGSHVRPLVVGALACGALLTIAPGAQANHRMANGMLCPHAAGEPVAGEGPATVNPGNVASSAPIAAARPAAAPSAQPQTNPAQPATAQRPASHAQAQRPATSQAQAQGPAQAQRPAPKVVASPQPATARTITRQLPVAHVSAAAKPRATVAERKPAATRAVQRPAVHPDSMRAAQPAAVATAATAASPAAAGALGIASALLALLVLGAIGVASWALAMSRRRVTRDDVAPAVRALTFAEQRDAAIEAELQAMIADTRARALRSPDVVDDVDDRRKLGATQ
jgi:hypothetical protein